MNISIFGCELTGMVTAGCLAKKGNNVVLVSMDELSDQAKGGVSLTHGEPSLTLLLSSQVIEKKLVYATDWDEAIYHADIIIISIPSWLLPLAEKVVDRIGKVAQKDVILVNQTTFSIGKSNEFEEKIKERFVQRSADFSVNVLSMPDLISKGTAVEEFLNPERVIIGGENKKAINTIAELMLPFYKDEKNLIIMTAKAAEYTRFTLNAVLATRISLINEFANNAELFGIDFAEVREGIGSDSRIGSKYINPGCGFGGPSFAADVNELVESFDKKGSGGRLLAAAAAENETQKEVLFRKAWRYFDNDLTNKTFAVWGLSFKPNTSSVENSPSLTLVKALISQGARVIVYDPKANETFIKALGDIGPVAVAEDKYEVLEDVDALFLLTDWETFFDPDLKRMKALMKTPVIFDGRNVYEPSVMAEEGIRYIGIGRGLVV
jgi:UDPglucose 6-dehydrogenase